MPASWKRKSQLSARELQVQRALSAPCIVCGADSPLGQHECELPYQQVRRKQALGGSPMSAIETIEHFVIGGVYPCEAVAFRAFKPGIYQGFVDSDLPAGSRLTLTCSRGPLPRAVFVAQQRKAIFDSPPIVVQDEIEYRVNVDGGIRHTNLDFKVLFWPA